MKKISIILISIFLFSSILSPFPVVHAEENIFIITPDIGVNLRAEPNKEASIVAKLKQGYRVKKIEDAGEWMKVSYNNSTGYIMKEYSKSLNHDLLSSYTFYAQILEETKQNSTDTYSLLYDFNQDGLEDLYLVNPNYDEMSELTFTHKLYNGSELVFEETLEEGLDIYWDDYNYYIVTNVSVNRGGIQYTPQELGIDFQADNLDTNISITGGKVIRPGNLKFMSIPYYKEHSC